MKAKKEEKYLVIKLEDLENYFSQFTKGVFTTEDEQDHINRLTWNEVIYALQNDNKYIVCNQDEPYAEEVWQIILKKESNNEICDGCGVTEGMICIRSDGSQFCGSCIERALDYFY